MTGEGANSVSNAQTMVENAADQQRQLCAVGEGGYRWVWEYCGAEADAPSPRLMVSEPLWPYERQLLRLSGGKPNVYEFAEHFDTEDW